MRISKYKIIIGALILSVIANIGLSYRLSNKEMKIAKVDIELLIGNLVKAVSAQGLSEEESKKFSQEYIKKLDQLLFKIAEEQGIVILPSKAVIAGAIDITDQIEELMRGNNAN